MSRDWPHRFEGTHKPEPRTEYKKVSKSGLAANGYETLAMANPDSPFEAEDRDTLGKDADYDINLVR